MDLAELYGLVTQGQYEFSAHAQRERLADDLDVIEIEQAVLKRMDEAYHDVFDRQKPPERILQVPAVTL